MVGMDAVNRSIKDMGFTATKLQRRMLEPGAANADRENISTPTEMARLAELLYRGKAVDETASREMIEILKLVSGNFRESIPDSDPDCFKAWRSEWRPRRDRDRVSAWAPFCS